MSYVASTYFIDGESEGSGDGDFPSVRLTLETSTADIFVVVNCVVERTGK